MTKRMYKVALQNVVCLMGYVIQDYQPVWFFGSANVLIYLYSS